jgi:hypothetical protein
MRNSIVAAPRPRAAWWRGGEMATMIQRLHAAAQEGDLTVVGDCLRSGGVGVDARNKKAHTALMLAAQNCHTELVRLLLACGANPLLIDSRRRTARDISIAARGVNGKLCRAGDVASLLEAAECRAAAITAAKKAEQAQPDAATDAVPNPTPPRCRCPVCGVVVRARQRVDYMHEDGRSRYVSDFLRSGALREMRGHPQHHHHQLLDARNLRKEVSESWAAVGAARDTLAELGLPPTGDGVVFFDLCSGKGLTAVSLALTFPCARVIAVDLISDKCLPHTSDIANLRYIRTDLFEAEPLLRAELTRTHTSPPSPEPEPEPRPTSQAGPAGRGGVVPSEQAAAAAAAGVGVLVGLHLCGTLSSQAIRLFRSIECCRALVLSPCCWPRRRDFGGDLAGR